MKLHELIKILNPDQDEITIIFSNDNNNVKSTYNDIDDIPISYCRYRVTEIYGYNAGGYDGLMISIVEE